MEIYVERIRREILEVIIDKIWKGEGIPGDWNKGVISPIHKRGERDEFKNYRRITLMNTAYKIYASILNEKLQRETEEKLREIQFGFRRGRGIMDAIYVLNYVINKKLSRKGGKVFAFFADLKAVFNNVNRRQLYEMMKKIKVKENLRLNNRDVQGNMKYCENSRQEDTRILDGERSNKNRSRTKTK